MPRSGHFSIFRMSRCACLAGHSLSLSFFFACNFLHPPLSYIRVSRRGARATCRASLCFFAPGLCLARCLLLSGCLVARGEISPREFFAYAPREREREKACSAEKVVMFLAMCPARRVVSGEISRALMK